MLDFLYPTDERQLFTNRHYHLGLLEMCCSELQAGHRKHLALLGLRRIGKTLILKEFILRWLQRPMPPNPSTTPTTRSGQALSEAEGPKAGLSASLPPVIPVYLDLKRVGLSPEFFAVEYIGSVLYWFQERGQGRLDDYARLPTLLRVATALGNQQILDILLNLDQDLRQQPIPQRRLLEQAFEFPEVLAREFGVRLLICMDEFQDISLLSNFPQVGNVLDIFRSLLQTQSHIAYVVAGSAISLMERIFHHAHSPLFVPFRSERVGPFTWEDSEELARKVLAEQTIPEEAARTLFAWTYGHPFYTYAVAERMKELALFSGREVNSQLVQEAFVLETLSTTGRIYNLCRYVIEESMGQARGQALLRLLLQILAEGEGPLPLADIARRLRRSAGVTRNLLNRLGEVDLVVQRNGTYDLPDPVLKIWLAYFHAGVELLAAPRREIMEQLVADISQRYQRLSSELGLAKESQVRELMVAFDGRQVPGRLFGQATPVYLPVFRQVAPYQSADGQLELDAVGQGETPWLVEVKWKNQPARRADLEAFCARAKALTQDLGYATYTLWFIARGGFKDSALRFAYQEGILMSSGNDLQELAELLGLRFGK